ncbi:MULTISPECIES: hypothetical protein [Sporomusa]|uniref:Uncharacterized protein n=2 Tax=Sporomusa TaxID=2375 RepID=A0ABP2C604_9FIRM|nr:MULTISPECIES: hypothetical protein [Sporomusa]OLS58722.1 hypothetical protein SPSPH_22820 [Sporomusa sphaeroides DSM 2875]CVK19768.1 hypothetical protein SSPH_02423 [Sporomusa sphaeroides DSM 2875]SCM79778.1 conserved hypothetical protein [uncultured Sporomusa sp.]
MKRVLVCEIIYQTTGERWGIFPRDIGEFQARLVSDERIINNSNTNTIIKRSANFEIISTSFTPDEKNKRHRKALEDLVQELQQAGWKQQPEQGTEWYNLTFRKK